MDSNKQTTMRKIIFGIVMILIFGCKKEKIDQKKIDLTGKIKILASKTSDSNKEFIYNDTSGLLERIIPFTISDTFEPSLIYRNDNMIYLFSNYKIRINNEGLIKSFKDSLDRNFIIFSYTNKLNYFGDLGTTNGRYDRFKLIDGNYTSYIHQYTSDFGFPVKDTFSIAYTNLSYNKYAPYQKLLIYQPEILDYLGYDDNYLFPQNKNLIESIHINGERIYDFEYEFNSLNQLVKTNVTSNGGVQEYSMEYY
jgi:hypothetical protein